MDAHRLTAEEVVRALATDPLLGLSSEDARARLESFGYNELASEPTASAWHRFAAQFKDGLVILVLAATAVSIMVWYGETASPERAHRAARTKPTAHSLIVLLRAGHAMSAAAIPPCAAHNATSAA